MTQKSLKQIQTLKSKLCSSAQKEKKNEIVKVKEKKINKVVEEEPVLENPISFTDKLSVEEILRAKIEQQERMRKEKKDLKKVPFDSNYTPEMMQERIKQHEGVNVRKEVNINPKDYKWTALALLIITLIVIIIIGALLIFKVIEL